MVECFLAKEDVGGSNPLTRSTQKSLDKRLFCVKLIPCMIKILQIVELVIAFLLIAIILLQQRGSGLGGAFGSEAAAYSTRRGFEKFLYYATIVLGTLFVLIAITATVIAARQL